MKKFLLLTLLLPLAVFSQYTVTPNSAVEGTYLQVFISGSSQELYAEYTPPQNRFTHSAYSNTNINLYDGYYDFASGGIYENISTNYPVGSYHLQNKGMHTGYTWQTLAYNAFEILPGPSILTVSPDEVTVDASFSISIIGENTQWLGQNIQNIRIVNNGYYYANNSSIISNNLILINYY